MGSGVSNMQHLDGDYPSKQLPSSNKYAAAFQRTSTMNNEQEVNEALKKSGLLDWIGILGAFRGVQNARFPGTIRGKIYWYFEAFSDLTSIFNSFSLVFMFVWADNKESRWLCAFPTVPCTLSIFLSLYPRFRRSKFRSLFASFDTVFCGHPNAIYLEHEIEKGATRTRTITYLLVMLQFVPMTFLCAILPLINEALNQAIMPRKMALPAMFPFDPVATLPNYLLAVFLHLCGCIFCNFKIIAFMETFFIFSLRLVAMFKILRLNLHEILAVLDEANSNYREFTDRKALSKHLVRLLKNWVKTHQQCIRILNEIEILFSWPFAVYFGFLTLGICTITLVVTDKSVDTMTVVLCGSFGIGAFTQLLMTCRVGDTITYEVDGLINAIEGTNFHLLNKEESKYLKIVLTRCQRTCAIKALGLFPLSIETLKAIMKSSYSYYTMLKKVNESSDE